MAKSKAKSKAQKGPNGRERKATAKLIPVPLVFSAAPKLVSQAKPENALAKLPKMQGVKRTRKPKPVNPCACGCNGDTKSTWVPGHDARHKGWVARIKAGVVELGDERITEGEREVLSRILGTMELKAEQVSR